MTGPLRIMTFNVQMLPWIADAVAGTTNDTPERAERVADAIFAIPAWDRPDIIAFNEVFDEDGRATLLSRLTGKWPHHLDKLSDGTVGAEDSGLMLFSNLPFRTLPSGDTYAEAFYGDSAGDDSMASKGVGIVQVDSPDGSGLPCTIAFTHLQASYDSEDQYSDVRLVQLDTVWNALSPVLEPGTGNFAVRLERTVLMGDLNVRGDSGAVSQEWSQVFDAAGTELTRNMTDAWRGAMHPPGDDTDYDRGVTNIEWTSGKEQRLDYMVFGHGEERPLVPQHMFSRIRNASDHFSLEAVVQARSLHCQPGEAVDFSSLTPIAGGQPGTPTTLTVVDTGFLFEGSFQWIYFPRPATFTFWVAPDVELRVFAQSDLSRALTPEGTLNVAELAGLDVGRALSDLLRERPVDPAGVTHAPPEPFFLAIRSRKNLTGNRAVFVLEHNGETAETAIVLRPNEGAQASYPTGRTLGDDDWCWFRAQLPTTFSGDPHDETFELDALPLHGPVRWVLRDSARQELDSAGGSDTHRALTVSTTGDELVYLVIERSNLADGTLAASWRCPISYLMLERPMGVYIDEETAGFGSDEVYLQLFLDGSPVFNGYWDDADSGERWPGLAEAMINAFRAQLPGTDRIGFVGDLTVSYVEDDITASGWSTEFVHALTPGEPDVVDRRVTLPVPDAIGDGRYSFYCSLSRHV